MQIINKIFLLGFTLISFFMCKFPQKEVEIDTKEKVLSYLSSTYNKKFVIVSVQSFINAGNLNGVNMYSLTCADSQFPEYCFLVLAGYPDTKNQFVIKEDNYPKVWLNTKFEKIITNIINRKDLSIITEISYLKTANITESTIETHLDEMEKNWFLGKQIHIYIGGIAENLDKTAMRDITKKVLKKCKNLADITIDFSVYDNNIKSELNYPKCLNHTNCKDTFNQPFYSRIEKLFFMQIGKIGIQRWIESPEYDNIPEIWIKSLTK